MELTKDNYFSPEANKAYWSVSQFKAFNKCEACGLAEVMGEYEREETDALLIGSYVDAYFSGERVEFEKAHADKLLTKQGKLYAKFQAAAGMIQAIERQPLMVEYMAGAKAGNQDGQPFRSRLEDKDGRIQQRNQNRRPEDGQRLRRRMGSGLWPSFMDRVLGL